MATADSPSLDSVAARDAAAVQWLLQASEPAVRLMARRDLAGLPSQVTGEEVLQGPRVRALLAGQQADGGFGVHPYRKWTGAHWRLVSLVELEVPPGHDRSIAAAETVLAWLCSPRRLEQVPVVNGLARWCASQEGNALAVCCRLGLRDERVDLLADLLLGWQWPDGGWNCDVRASGRRSSFHETLPAIWGLTEYARLTGTTAAQAAARRGTELLLEHRLFRSVSTGDVIDPSWVRLRYPPYWHYNVLQALLVLRRVGAGPHEVMAGTVDERADDARVVLRRRQRPDGRWQPGGRWWKNPGSANAPEAVDWRPDGESQMLTLNALRVLTGG